MTLDQWEILMIPRITRWSKEGSSLYVAKKLTESYGVFEFHFSGDEIYYEAALHAKEFFNQYVVERDVPHVSNFRQRINDNIHRTARDLCLAEAGSEEFALMDEIIRKRKEHESRVLEGLSKLSAGQ